MSPVARTAGITSLVASAAVLSNCKVGPEYAPPKQQSPAAWSIDDNGGGAGLTSHSADMLAWWEALSDPALNELIWDAVRTNNDLRLAQARVREARAQRGVIGSDLYPNVDVNARYTHSRRSENTAGFSGTSGFGIEPETDLFEAGFDASWELDVFGGLRRAVEAADADVEAAVESRRDALVTLVAEVARNYVELRSAQRRLDIARQNIDAQRQTLELSTARFNAGLVSELDVARAKAQLAATSSQLPVFETAIKQAITALSVLLAREPNALIDELATTRGNAGGGGGGSLAQIPRTPPQVPVGLPSDLLRRRPDVRRAERQLAAATAQIGVATAELFPRFILNGSAVGFAAQDADKLFRSDSTTFGVGPSVSWRVFDGGRIRSNINVHNARQEQALIQYEQAVISSLGDVENAMVAYWKEQSRRRSLAEAVEANQRAVELSQELYTRGLGDFLSVLDSQRSLYLSQDQLVQSDQAVTAGYIAIYKALGGGWQVFEPKAEEGTVASR